MTTPTPETLTRYAYMDESLEPDEDGNWVLYTDHLAALTAERARADKWKRESEDLAHRVDIYTGEIEAEMARAERAEHYLAQCYKLTPRQDDGA